MIEGELQSIIVCAHCVDVTVRAITHFRKLASRNQEEKKRSNNSAKKEKKINRNLKKYRFYPDKDHEIYVDNNYDCTKDTWAMNVLLIFHDKNS